MQTPSTITKSKDRVLNPDQIIMSDELTLSPQKFARFLSRNRQNIKTVKFILPKFGRKDFGHFRVVLKRSTLQG
jgi:hypothetical protein